MAHPHKADAVTYGKSWSEDIQRYHAAKATLPWTLDQQTPVKHVTRFEKAREEREYDVVLGKFRDAEREVSRVRQEKDKLEGGLEHARAKQLRNVQRFNVVNHSPMFSGARDPKDAPPQPHQYRAKIAPEFNIVTNISNNKDGGAPEQIERSESPSNQAHSRRPTREFNILTNKYHENHDTKAQLDDVKRKEIAAIKYYKTRSFDPVRITFVDEQRELAFARDREQEQLVHGKDRVLMLPPREQFSEGRLYNILNQQVINADKIGAASEKDQRALNKMQKTGFEAKMRVLGDEALAKETTRCLNRFAHERNAQTYVHGYDPITNEPFDGRTAKPTMPTRTHAGLSAWQVLESGVLTSAKVSTRKPSTAAATAARRQEFSITTPTLTEVTASDRRSAVVTPQRPNVLVVDHDTSSSVSSSEPQQVRRHAPA